MVHTLENLMEFHGADAKELSGNTILILEMRSYGYVMMEQ
jgi:hypothetical protein